MQVMVRGMIADVAFRTGEMYGAFNEEGAMVGFQTWTPPGKKQFMLYVGCPRLSAMIYWQRADLCIASTRKERRGERSCLRHSLKEVGLSYTQ